MAVVVDCLVGVAGFCFVVVRVALCICVFVGYFAVVYCYWMLIVAVLICLLRVAVAGFGVFACLCMLFGWVCLVCALWFWL